MKPIADTSDWYLAQLKPNCANIAKRNLERQGFASFLPLEAYTKVRGGKFVAATRPYFPGYIFISICQKSAPWRAIRSTSGIVRLISFNDTPAKIPQQVMTEILSASDERGIIHHHEDLKPGDQVEITKGSLTGFIGRIDKLTAQNRVWVLIDIMGKETRASVKISDIK